MSKSSFFSVSTFIICVGIISISTLVGEAQPPNTESSAPVVKIIGAESPVKVGEIVQLSALLDNTPADLHSVAYSWTILPAKEVINWPDGTKIIFGTGTSPKTYTAILTASFVFVQKDGDKILNIIQKANTQSVNITIEGSSGENKPNPTYPEDELSGLAKKAYDWIALIQRSDNYIEEDIRADAEILAKSFMEIAIKIDKSELSDATNILNMTKDRNNTVLTRRNEWQPWFTKMSEYLEQAYKNGEIRTPAQFSQAWKQIAIGLSTINN